MDNKKILGLDIGTNSIGWSLIEQDFNTLQGRILGMGTRIIPMGQDILGDFGKGNSVSQTAERTRLRGVRRLIERHHLRRERLNRVLNVMKFLPNHYVDEIDFEKKFGQFKNYGEPKIAFYKDKSNGAHQFLFMESFEEMLDEFKKYNPNALVSANGANVKIPFDWTLYYLRTKALTQKISPQELSWVLLSFNQKRGYYQLRGEEEEENPNKKVEFHTLKIIDIIPDEQQSGKKEKWYSLVLENGWVYRRSSKISLDDWLGKERDFIVTTDLNDDGSIKKDKEGKEVRSFRAPNEGDWVLEKKRTEKWIKDSDLHVGEYIFKSLLSNPNQKIRGKLVATIERALYKQELKDILNKQLEFHPEMRDEALYAECVRELYRNNSAHRELLSSKDFIHLFLEDILFYQRPLRSQKFSISSCPLEFRYYVDKDNVKHYVPIKVASKSNPYFQEFRLWQWLNNLAINNLDGENVTKEFIATIDDFIGLFDYLNERKEIDEKTLLKHLLSNKGFRGKSLNNEIEKYKWNYVNNKTYPCNETGSLIRNKLAKVVGISDDFLTSDRLYQLWHIIYSVKDKFEYTKALSSFAADNHIDLRSFVDAFIKIAPFPSDYAGYSEKAIKKLLTLMRMGKYWKWDNIFPEIKNKIDKLMTGEFDEEIPERVREKALHLQRKESFQGLPLYLAQYIIYGRHSESASQEQWNSPADITQYLAKFKQHSLRNPIVEQVVTEALRVVRDVWMNYGKGEPHYFDEIHVELARELKKTKDERKRSTEKISENENTNIRIKTILEELLNDPEVENVRPYSPMQQDILKLYEEGALGGDGEIDEDILKISKSAQPTQEEIKKYKLWMQQRYRSP